MMVTGTTIVVTGGNSGIGAAIDVVADAVVPRRHLRRETPPPPPGHRRTHQAPVSPSTDGASPSQQPSPAADAVPACTDADLTVSVSPSGLGLGLTGSTIVSPTSRTTSAQ